MKYIGQYADKYYLLDLEIDYTKKTKKVYVIIYDQTKGKKKKLIVRNNGYIRVNNESIYFYDLNG